MKPFQSTFEPVALRGDVLALLPEGNLRRVKAVEPLAEIGPVSFGSISSGGTATSSGNDVIEQSAAEMNTNQVGQYRIEPLSPVDVKVNQDNRRDQRFDNADRRGIVRRGTPPQAAELYVHGSGNPYFEVTNPNNYDLDDAYITLYGFKIVLEPGELSEDQVNTTPKGIPVDKLEKTSQEQTAASSVAQSIGRGD